MSSNQGKRSQVLFVLVGPRGHRSNKNGECPQSSCLVKWWFVGQTFLFSESEPVACSCSSDLSAFLVLDYLNIFDGACYCCYLTELRCSGLEYRPQCSCRGAVTVINLYCPRPWCVSTKRSWFPWAANPQRWQRNWECEDQRKATVKWAFTFASILCYMTNVLWTSGLCLNS